MKRCVFIILFTVMLTGCVPTKSEVEEQEENIKNNNFPEVELLGEANQEEDLNIVRDQLEQNGFKVNLKIAPDSGTYRNLRHQGNFDISNMNWTVVTGNPDAAVRDLLSSEGTVATFSDQKVDDLINKAASEELEDAVNTYEALENYAVFEEAYILPLYQEKQTRVFNQDAIKKDSVRLPKSRALPWETLEYKENVNTDRILNLSQTESEITSLDPIKAKDQSINMLNTNMYTRLVNLTDDDQATSDGTLSHKFAMNNKHDTFYFLLRDDIHFSKVEDKKAIDTKEMVSGKDVVYSLNRAKDKDSVPDHQTYNFFESIESVEIVEDMSELEDVTTEGDTVKDVFNIDHVVTDEEEVNNKKGDYQVIKLTTNRPFPQVLNYLAHQSAGIVSKQQVSKINDEAEKEEAGYYGTSSKETIGNGYNPDIYASGPYIMIEKDNYHAKFEKNPGFMSNTEFEPKIPNIHVNFSDDPDSSLSKLRNNEIDMLDGIEEDKFIIVDDDPKLKRLENDSNTVSYLNINMEREKFSDNKELRRALLYSIDQSQFESYYHNDVVPASSVVAPLVDTGNELKNNKEKVQEEVDTYNERTGK